jgi:hypothetical protein
MPKRPIPKNSSKSDPSHLVLGHGKLVGYLNTTKSQKMQKNCPSKTLSKLGSNFWGKMNISCQESAENILTFVFFLPKKQASKNKA